MIEATRSPMQPPKVQGVLIGDEMGLGKTAQALAVCKALQAERVLIVCPSTLRQNWKREIRKVLQREDVHVLLGTKPSPVREKIAIIGYDVLYAWSGLLSADVLILDEVHAVKSWTARRTKAAVEVADRVRARGGIVLGLSGTPVLNRPMELASILRTLGLLSLVGGVDRLSAVGTAPRRLVS